MNSATPFMIFSVTGTAFEGPRHSDRGDFFGHDQLRSLCLQVQPVTCSHSSVFFYEIGVYSFIHPFKMIGDFLAVLNFNWLLLKLDRFICNQLAVLSNHRLRLDAHMFQSVTPANC